MKTLKLSIVCLLSFISIVGFGQKKKKDKVDEKTKHFFKIPEAIEKSDYKVEFKNIVSKFEYLKFALVLTNKTDDFLIYDNTKSKIVFDWGEKTTAKPKTWKFKPYSTGNRTFLVEGGTQMLVNNFKFVLQGVSKVPTNGRVQKVEDFKLPEETNSVKAGNFTLNLKRVKKKTDETSVKFEVIYNGDDVAVIKTNEISVRINDNDIFANEVKKSIPSILNKGDKMAFTAIFRISAKVADMQFADMFIQWNNTFSESKVVPLSGSEVEFILDELLTKEKN